LAEKMEEWRKVSNLILPLSCFLSPNL
jgi:hypothetical protein